MLTEIKLVQNPHSSLQCWYRTSLVFTRKTNPKRNRTGIKINIHCPLQCWYRTSLGITRKTNANRNQTGKNTHCSLQCWYRTSLVFTRKTNANKNQSGRKIHTVSYNAGIEPLCYSGEKQMLTGIRLVQNTHCSLQCWYRSNLVFTRKTNANKNQTGTNYTLHLTILL